MALYKALSLLLNIKQANPKDAEIDQTKRLKQGNENQLSFGRPGSSFFPLSLPELHKASYLFCSSAAAFALAALSSSRE